MIKRTLNLLLWVAVLGTAPPAFGEHEEIRLRAESETFKYLGESFPDSNLKDQFREEIPHQGATSACGSFAAIGVLEAACKRAIHKDLDLSEAFVAYRQIRRHYRDHSLDDFELRDGEKLLGASEAQNPSAILKDVQTQGAICTEGELGFDKELFPLIQDLKAGLLARFHDEKPITKPVAEPKPTPPRISFRSGPLLGQLPDDLPQVPASADASVTLLGVRGPFSPVPAYPDSERGIAHLKELTGELCTSLDGNLQCRLGSQRSDSMGVLPTSLTPHLNSCLAALAPAQVIKNASVKQALFLLAAGQPLACTDSGLNGRLHAFVLQGARASREHPNRIEWLVRDSAAREEHKGKPTWVSWNDLGSVCQELVALPTQAETAKVEALIEATSRTKEVERAERVRVLTQKYGNGPWPSDAY